MRIGIDLMGSDRSPQVLFDAVIQAAKQLDLTNHFVVFADPETISDLKNQTFSSTHSSSMAGIEFYPVNEVITMLDEPVEAVRKKKNSSIVQGIRLLKKKHPDAIDAFVSAGNTGALVAAATLNLSLLPSIRRPAILASLPTETGHVSVIDVGGNVSCKAAHMVSFAQLGACFEKIQHGIQVPKVGLLNIGVESKKGTHEHRLAYRQLSNQEETLFQFEGNVEGREVFQGKVHVLVTDGFAGNVLLKTTEGVATFILDFLRKNAGASSIHTQHLLQQMQSHFSYNEYPGALLLGTEGIIVKCHGDSSSKALFNSIKAAIRYVEIDLIGKLQGML